MHLPAKKLPGTINMKTTQLRKNFSNLQWYGCIFIILLIAYLPISSFQLAIKNDFFQAYFPVKFFLSKSINAGEWPLWNPFLNYGFPIYGDMSASYWNPLTWIFALIGYDVYLFTLEHLIYLFLAGIGMFKLMGNWTENNFVRLIVAASYLCSGFATSHQQHFNWITALGLLPFSIHYSLAILKDSGKVNTLKWVLTIAFYATAVHPGMIIGLMMLLICMKLFIQKDPAGNKIDPWIIISAIIIFILLILGMAYGYTDVIPYTNRSQPVAGETGIAGSTSVSNWISFIFPLMVNDKSGIFMNELTLRNCYIGLVLFALMIQALLSPKRKGLVISLYITGLFFLLLSSDLIHIIYEKIPIINYVRLNAEFRLFALITMILAGGIQLEAILKKNDQKFTLILNILLIISVTIFVGILLTGGSQFFSTGFTFAQLTNSEGIKFFIDHFSWKDSLLIQSVIQSICLLVMIRTYLRGHIIFFTLAVIGELMLNAFIQLPFTAVGRNSLREIQQLVEQSPKKSLTPSLDNESDITKNYPSTEKLIGGWGFYSNQIALKDNLYYPLMLTKNMEYFTNGTQSKLTRNPFIFSKNNATHYTYKKTGYAFWTLQINVKGSDTLIIKQNNFNGWHASIDRSQVPIFTEETSLLGLSVIPGKYEVLIHYKRDSIKILLIMEWLTFLLMLTYLIRDYLIRYILPYPALKN